MSELTAEDVRRRLSYDPDTGVMRYLTHPRKKLVGEVAGSVANHGYLVLGVKHKTHLLHRVAWLHFYGEWPESNLDHINKGILDNRIGNLRECLQVENMQNKRKYKNNSSGCTGVVWNKKSNRWQAQIQVRGKNVHLGFFVSKEDAVKARRAAEPVIHPFSLEETR